MITIPDNNYKGKVCPLHEAADLLPIANKPIRQLCEENEHDCLYRGTQHIHTILPEHTVEVKFCTDVQTRLTTPSQHDAVWALLLDNFSYKKRCIGTFFSNHFSGNRLNVINSGSNRLNNLKAAYSQNFRLMGRNTRLGLSGDVNFSMLWVVRSSTRFRYLQWMARWFTVISCLISRE